MPRLPLMAKGAGLVLALFSPLLYANEWQSYLDLKAALIRSEKTVKPRPLPNWLTALDFEPRPHYWLENKNPPVTESANVARVPAPPPPEPQPAR